ncbi:MAG: peptidoglycan-binding protein [Isosphaeraceae bacterium]
MNKRLDVRPGPPRPSRGTFGLILTLGLLLGWAGHAPGQSEPPLKAGDVGPAVESLQRRLNAKLSPSPGLDVDGDFGEATGAALRKFQVSQGLPPSGLLDPKTSKALGNDPGPGPEPPPPDEVNRRPIQKQPPDAIDGPPFVTSKAWAIANGKTGEILWGDDADQPLDMASTTKIMTAMVTLRVAREKPELLDDWVTFSERADKTTGSTSGVRAGERLPLRELLYGLLLPSGNDASVALGEHVGQVLGPGADGDPLVRFVAEMNTEARALGLRESHFANTHGLTAPDHKTSARDLATLARKALEDPIFAEVVATPIRGSTLTDADGHRRNVVWKNTNRLLNVEGYDGVKTGTTSAAGNCLVASGRRGDDHLIVVVLGSASTDGRYADARNLFRWAWRRRGHDVQDRP